jgi:hypothetical protein
MLLVSFPLTVGYHWLCFVIISPFRSIIVLESQRLLHSFGRPFDDFWRDIFVSRISARAVAFPKQIVRSIVKEAVLLLIG